VLLCNLIDKALVKYSQLWHWSSWGPQQRPLQERWHLLPVGYIVSLILNNNNTTLIALGFVSYKVLTYFYHRLDLI